MRFEANISLRPAGASALGNRVEVKNLNSFRAVLAQHRVRDRAPEPDPGRRRRASQQETMGWDEAARRHRAAAQQGRGPRLPLLPGAGPAAAGAEPRVGGGASAPACRSCPTPGASASWPSWACRATTPACWPRTRPSPPTSSRAVAAAGAGEAKTIANWILGELFRLMKESGEAIGDVKVTPDGAGRAGGPGRRRASSPTPSPRTSSPRCSPPARRRGQS